MLSICGNGEVIKPLIIFEKSFPLVGDGKSVHIPQWILHCKTNKGPIEKDVFSQWFESSVISHKKLVNPNDFSWLILDNHGSRFSVDANEICAENKIKMLCYPIQLTHILQDPGIVLNKTISSIVDKMIHNKPVISGNSDASRIAFMAIIDHALKTICTNENVLKVFSATGLIP